MRPRLFCSAIVAAMIAICGPTAAQDYRPGEGDSVVIYINTFKPDGYDKARKLMIEGFGGAMSASGQTRDTFWVANPQTREIVGISFFKKGHSVDQWHDHDARAKILQQLEPLRSSPQVRMQYEVIGTHNTGN